MTREEKTSPSNPLDPRAKLFIVAVMSSMAVFIKDHFVLLGILIATSLMLFVFGVGMGFIWKKARAFIAVVIFVALVQSVFGKGGKVLLSIGSLGIVTEGGLSMAIEFMLRILIIITSALLLTTSNSRDIIQGLIQWKLPYEIAFMAVLGLRFLPVFGEEFKDAKIAMELRGVDIKKLKLKKKLEVYAGLMQPVVAGALLRARGLSLSMEMRGFRAFDKRISYRELKLKPIDYLIMAATGIAALAVIIIK